MSVSSRVVARLRDQHGVDLPADTYVRRLYSGWAMKANGAWSWSLWSNTDPSDRNLIYGSQWPATQLLRCKDWQIDPPTRNTPDRAIEPCKGCLDRERQQEASTRR